MNFTPKNLFEALPWAPSMTLPCQSSRRESRRGTRQGRAGEEDDPAADLPLGEWARPRALVESVELAPAHPDELVERADAPDRHILRRGDDDRRLLSGRRGGHRE